MMFLMLFFYCLLSLVSCSYSPDLPVTVALYQDLPWEAETGEMMWFRLKYFDGNKVRTVYWEEGQREVRLPVSFSRPSVFALYPLGNLSPLGGFRSGGEDSVVYLYPEYGSFASMLLDAAEVRPKVVEEVNMKRILEEYPDLLAVDRQKALVSLYDGTWDEEKFSLSKRYSIPLEGVLTGRWISLLSSQDTFVRKSVSVDAFLHLFPGVWYYLNKERNLVLSIVVSEKGEYWMKLSEKPKWY